jgi:hypothetical protein
MQTETFRNDPLLYDFELPLRAVYHPMGFSVEVVTNAPEVLAGARESWGHSQKIFWEAPLEVRIGVLENGSKQCPPPPVFRGQRNLVSVVCDTNNFAVCDLSLGFAFCWLTQAAASHRAYLRYHFLEGVVSVLLESLYLTSAHAACVSLGGRGILLCGASGAGKSSLSFACARNGWTFTSDDASCVVRNRKGRLVVGNPYQMRFRESAIELFPELERQRFTPRLNGEMAIELATRSLPEISTAPECPVDYIVFLNRGNSSPPELLRFHREKALQFLEQTVCFGEEQIRAAHYAALDNLLTAEVFELQYSDLESAVKRLETLVRNGV